MPSRGESRSNLRFRGKDRYGKSKGGGDDHEDGFTQKQ